MVNRYDNPAQAEFINTYVPIPFEELYTLGRAAGERLNNTLTQYANARKLWSDFQSQSAVDMQRWDDLTMGRVRPYIDAAAANPDLMKDSAWQMQIQSAIANTDTAALGRLRQNAANFDNYTKSLQQLMKEGKYNYNWHHKDFSNWDTLGSNGLFNETPMPYESVPNLVNPYVDNLEDTDLGVSGGYIWYGVTPERARAQVDAHASDILNNPQAQRHIQEYMRQGLTPEQATNTFMNEVYKAAEERARMRRTADPYGLLNMRASIARSAREEASNNPDVYSQAYTTANEALRQNILTDPNFTQSRRRVEETIRIGNEIAMLQQSLRNGEITQKQYESMLKDYDQELAGMNNALRNDTRNIFTLSTGLNPNAVVSKERLVDYNRGVSGILDKLFVPSSSQIDDAYNLGRSNGTIEFNSGSLTANGYMRPTSQNIMLSTEWANKVMGVGSNGTKLMAADENRAERNISEMFKDGRFKNVLVLPNYQNTTTGMDGSNNVMQRMTVLVPRSAVVNAGLDIDSFESAYKQAYGDSGIITDGIYTKSNPDTGAKNTTLQDTYYMFDCVEEMPNTGTLRTMLDQNVNKTTGGTTMQNNEYGSNLDQSYQNLTQWDSFQQMIGVLR